MKILVTGGAGFIGSHLCERLLARGDDVMCVDNLNDFYDPAMKRRNLDDVRDKARALGASFAVEQLDICEGEALSELIARFVPDAVAHLAAYAGVRPSIQNPALYTRVNVMGTVSVLEAMKAAHVKRLVFASSSSVYGNNEKVPFCEIDPVDHPISPYAATKKAGELICHTYHALEGFSVACLRFFTVYGARQRPDLAIRKFAGMIERGEELPFYGDGSASRDYTYIDDIMDGVIKALDWTEGVPKYEVFNLGESATISLSAMVETLEAAMGKKAQLRRLPMQPGDVLRTNADIGKARRMLGYAPATPFDEGIGKFIAWYNTVKHEGAKL